MSLYRYENEFVVSHFHLLLKVTNFQSYIAYRIYIFADEGLWPRSEGKP